MILTTVTLFYQSIKKQEDLNLVIPVIVTKIKMIFKGLIFQLGAKYLA